MLKPPLLVSAASDSSEVAPGGRFGEMPSGRQATGKPSPDTSCRARDAIHEEGRNIYMIWHRSGSLIIQGKDKRRVKGHPKEAQYMYLSDAQGPVQLSWRRCVSPQTALEKSDLGIIAVSIAKNAS